jgi:hypothetical protein
MNKVPKSAPVTLSFPACEPRGAAAPRQPPGEQWALGDRDPGRRPPGPAPRGQPGCLPSQIWSHRVLPGGSATCPGDTGRSRDTGDTVGTGVGLVTDEFAEPTGSSRGTLRLETCRGAAMAAVSSTTAYAARPRPGRSRTCRGRAGESRLTSGSRRSVLSHGGREGWPAGEWRSMEGSM